MTTSYALPLTVFFAGLFLIVAKDNGADQVLTMDDVRSLAIQHISRLPKGTMIVFDFDDTLFDPHTIIDHAYAGKREFWHGERRALPLYKPVQHMCDVLKYASAAGMYITLITARPDTVTTKQVVLYNFQKQKMQLHEYHANSEYPHGKDFKARIREKIQKFRPIGLTIGDQWGDIKVSGGRDPPYHFIKLRSSRDPLIFTSLR